MADLTGNRLGDYTLLERIGRGGMSDVYRAKTDSPGVEVAVKVLTLDPEQEESTVFLARFEREARIAAELNHPHLLPVTDYGREGNFVYFVTQLVQGGTLADRIRMGALAVDDVCRLLEQIAAALDHAHDLQVIHRDLKPSNVLLDVKGNAYLTDFGIAWLTSQTSGLTQTGSVVGTPAYMAPEQWRAETLDARTDVYGLAVMTYLMLTCQVPFNAENAHSMMYQHLDQVPPSVRLHAQQIPEAVDRVVLRALAKNPTERYASAGELAADFKRAALGQPTLADTALAPTPPRTPLAVEFPPPVYPHYPIPDRLRHRGRGFHPRWLLVAFGMTVALVAGGVLLVFFLTNSDVLGSDANRSTPSPQVTLNQRPLDAPRVRLDEPRERSVEVALGTPLMVRAAAFDSQGVTRVELRRDNETLQSQVIDPPGSPVEVQFVFTPTEIGQHHLEIVAFRGDLAGDARFVTVTAR